MSEWMERIWRLTHEEAMLRHEAEYEQMLAMHDALAVSTLADVTLPTHCACGQLLERTEDLERHVERGCWKEEK